MHTVDASMPHADSAPLAPQDPGTAGPLFPHTVRRAERRGPTQPHGSGGQRGSSDDTHAHEKPHGGGEKPHGSGGKGEHDKPKEGHAKAHSDDKHTKKARGALPPPCLSWRDLLQPQSSRKSSK
jgi:hypothetical protein